MVADGRDDSVPRSRENIRPKKEPEYPEAKSQKKNRGQKPKKEPGAKAEKKAGAPWATVLFSAFAPGSFLSFWPNVYSKGFLPWPATSYIKGCPVNDIEKENPLSHAEVGGFTCKA